VVAIAIEMVSHEPFSFLCIGLKQKAAAAVSNNNSAANGGANSK
jgi:hypothetical protein